MFEQYSKYYDLLYKQKNYLKEVSFVEKIFDKYKITEIRNLLTLGCGTASHEIVFAQKGYKITGIDISKTMLDIAKNKIKNLNLENNISLIKGDVRKIKLTKKFEAVLALFNVMGYQISNNDVENTLMGVSGALKKGGLFIFDCWHTPAVLIDKPTNRVKSIKEGENTISRITNSKLDPLKNLIKINFKIVDSKNSKSVSETHTMRYFSIPEISYFLNKNGMELVNVYNFLDLTTKVKDDKWNIFIVAKKK